jgi:hypothetical protein
VDEQQEQQQELLHQLAQPSGPIPEEGPAHDEPCPPALSSSRGLEGQEAGEKGGGDESSPEGLSGTTAKQLAEGQGDEAPQTEGEEQVNTGRTHMSF